MTDRSANGLQAAWTCCGLCVLLLSGWCMAQVQGFPPGYGLLHSCTVDALKTRYTCLADGDIRVYITGVVFIFKVPEANPGPVKLQIGTLPAKPIRRTFAHPNPDVALNAEPFYYTINDVAAYDLRKDSLIAVGYDGTGWQILQGRLEGQQ